MIVQDAKPRPSGTRAKRRPSEQALVTAAVLIEEQVPDADIAAAFGVSRRTLNRWKAYPEMQLLASAFLVQWKRQHWKQAGKVSAGEFSSMRVPHHHEGSHQSATGARDDMGVPG
jgi:hypothetical protein